MKVCSGPTVGAEVGSIWGHFNPQTYISAALIKETLKTVNPIFYIEEEMKTDAVKDNRWKKGISPVIATILIVIVAIALVGIAWAIMSGFLGTASVKTDIAVEKLDIVANGMSVAVVRNVGNVRIDSIDEITLTCTSTGSPATPASFEPGSIDPGKTATATWDAGDLVPGETCTLTIKATAANGAGVAASSSAIVRP